MGRKMTKRRKIAIGLAFAVAVAAGGTVTVSKLNKKDEKPLVQAKQTAVSLSKMDLTKSVSATGTIESAKVKTVSANVTGVEIKNIKVSEGDVVKKGQTLLTFDKTDLLETLSEAKENLSDVKSQTSSELSSAERKLNEAQETYESQKEQMDANVKAAKKNYESAKKTLSKAKMPEEQNKAKEALSQAKASYEQAKNERKTSNSQNNSNVQSAKEQLATTKSNIKKSIKEAENKVSEASDALEDATIKAPMSGTVTAVGVEENDIYNGGDMIEISDCDSLIVTASISEYDISDIKKGQKVVILTDATGDTEIEGKITYVALTTGSSLSSGNSSGSASGNTGNTSVSSSSGYEIRVAITDKDDKLRSGMTAKCSIILEEAPDVYAVPYDAICTDENNNYYINVRDESGNKKQITVTKGMESDYYVEVSGDDLTEGLSVIIPTDEVSAEKADAEESSSGALDGIAGGGSDGNKEDFGGKGGFSGGAPDGGGHDGGGRPAGGGMGGR